jgi:hypothetical protein
MGPARTIDNAYIVGSAGKRKKSQATSGQWTADSAAYNWRERAARWDIAQLSAVVPETAGVIFEAIREFSRQVLAEVQAGAHKPKNWTEVKDALIVLAGFVSPDVITAAVDNSSRAGDDAQGRDAHAPGDGPPAAA